MLFDRRTLLRGAAAATFSPRLARAAVTDASGRAISIPEKVERVFAAGPPAAILLYTFAPDLLIGWTRNHDSEQCEFPAAATRRISKFCSNSSPI
jgi:iron complex transport system substrate-binding protein